MAFIIPDKILETLVCDTCNKYLSVKPIIVYPNRRKKCGRCIRSKKQTDGVVSLYRVIAEKCIFKCVNRFDGCRDLLTYSQVADHEKTCLEKVHKCPICTDGNDIPTFFLIKHFRDNHKETILEHPSLFFNLEQRSEITQIYFYQSQDDLFLLYLCNSSSEGLVKVNVFHLGNIKAAKNIIHQFTVTSESNKGFNFKSKEDRCRAYGLENSNTLCIKIPNSIQTVCIAFELIRKSQELIPVPLVTELDKISCEKIYYNVPPEKANFIPMVSTTLARKIFLNKKFQERFPEVSLSKCGTALIRYGVRYSLHCFNCQEICWRGLSKDNLVWKFYFSTKFEHSICYYCFQMLNQEKVLYENDYTISNLDNYIELVEFFCKFNCGGTFNAQHNFGHEEFCSLQPLQHCPNSDCSFAGTLSEISNHLQLHPGKEITTYSNFYISALFNREIYVFVQNQFARLQVTANNAGLNISADMCEQSKKTKGIKPIVLLFDDNKFFLMKFDKSITKTSNNHWIKMIIN